MRPRPPRLAAGRHWAALLLLPLLLATAITQFGAGEESGRCFLWEVRGAEGKAYLFGSVHLATPQIYPLDRAIEAAFAESAVLALEVDPAAAKGPEVQKLIAEAAFYPDGETVRDHLAPETLTALQDYFEKQNAPFELYANHRPWLLSQVLTLTALSRLGATPAHGLDLHFRRRAAAAEMPVKELESVRFQIEMLAGFEPAVQEQMLRTTLAEIEKLETFFPKLLRLWQSGDAAGMNRLMQDERDKNPAAETYFRKLLDERNVGMAESIRAYLASGRTHFVVVGAGHIGGEKGILALLRREPGLTIRQVPARGRPAAAEEPDEATEPFPAAAPPRPAEGAADEAPAAPVPAEATP